MIVQLNGPQNTTLSPPKKILGRKMLEQAGKVNIESDRQVATNLK